MFVGLFIVLSVDDDDDDDESFPICLGILAFLFLTRSYVSFYDVPFFSSARACKISGNR